MATTVVVGSTTAHRPGTDGQYRYYAFVYVFPDNPGRMFYGDLHPRPENLEEIVDVPDDTIGYALVTTPVPYAAQGQWQFESHIYYQDDGVRVQTAEDRLELVKVPDQPNVEDRGIGRSFYIQVKGVLLPLGPNDEIIDRPPRR